MAKREVGIYFRAYDQTHAGVDRIGQSMRRLEKQVLSVAAAYIGLRGMTNMFRSLTKAAMDAEESEQLFAISMDNSADAARRWSEEMSRALGLNAYEVRKNIGTMNVMFESMGTGSEKAYEMAKGLSQLAYDMASFYNLHPEEAFNKLRSAMAGQARPMMELGVVVNETMTKEYALRQGWIKHGETLSETGKLYARYNVIAEATQKAQGDLARTANSATNTERRLQAQFANTRIVLGKALLPAYQQTMAGISGYLQSNMTDMQAWGEGTINVIGTVIKSYLSLQRAAASAFERSEAESVINRTAQARYRIEHPDDTGAFSRQFIPGGFGGGVTAPQAPKYPETFEAIKRQLRGETEAVWEERDKLLSELRTQALTGKYADVNLSDYTIPALEPGGSLAAGLAEEMNAAADNITATTARMYREIGSQSQAAKVAALAEIMEQRRAYEDMGIDAAAISEWYQGKVTQWRKGEKDAGIDIVQATAQMYDEIDSRTAASYEARRRLIEQQRDLLLAANVDEIAVQEWHLNKMIKLYEEQASATQGFWAGAGAGMSRMSREMDRIGDLGENLSVSLRDNLVNGLTDAAWQAQTLGDSLRNVLMTLGQMATKWLMMQSVTQLMSFAFPSLVPSAMGNVFGSSGITPFGRGDVISRPTLFPFAGGIGLAGEAGDEAIMPLRRNSAGRLGVEAAAPKIEVNVHNENARDIEVTVGDSRMDAERTVMSLFVRSKARRSRMARAAR